MTIGCLGKRGMITYMAAMAMTCYSAMTVTTTCMEKRVTILLMAAGAMTRFMTLQVLTNLKGVREMTCFYSPMQVMAVTVLSVGRGKMLFA